MSESPNAKIEIPQNPEQPHTLPDGVVVKEMATAERQPEITPVTTSETVASGISVNKEQLEEIEEILSDGVKDFYDAMQDLEKKRFRDTGEKLARDIYDMLQKGHASFKKFLDAIIPWLTLIPHVNQFYLEKEAKKRADKLIKMHEDTKNSSPLLGILLAQAGGSSPFFEGSSATQTITTSSNSITTQLLSLAVIFVVLIISLAVVLWLIRKKLRSRHDFGMDAHMVTLLITIPKEQQLKDKTGDATIEQIRGHIATCETFLSTIGGRKAEHGLTAWFFGRTDHLSFEIASYMGLIYFYISTPRKFRTAIEQQLQAQFPSVNIDEVDDYNFFNPKDVVIGAYMRYTKSYSYPFKTFQQTESDPLNGILNPLTKLSEGTGVAIQYIVRSAHPNWRLLVQKHGKEISEGKKSGGVLSLVSDLFHALTAKSDDTQKTPYSATPLEQELVKKMDEKQSRAGLDCNTRIMVSAPTDATAQLILKNVINSYSQYNLYQFGNSFQSEVPRKPHKLIKQCIYRSFDEKRNMLVNTEELASLWHLPLPFTEVPNIKWLSSRSAPPPQNVFKEGVVLGYNIYRGVRTEIRIGRLDRARHMYVIGMTGTGKSTLLSNQASQDIKNGEGCCIMDPHGELAEAVLGTVPPERIDDVVYLDPADVARPIGLNVLEFDEEHPEQKTFVINEFIKILDRLYNLKETGGPMFESYLRNAILLNMSHPESGNTLMEISKVLAHDEFRAFKLTKCDNKPVHDFWVKEAEKAGGEASLANMVPYITTKLNQFIGNDIMRPIIAQQKSAINFREMMDTKKILLINLSKGKLGEMNSNLLGLIIVGKILAAALARADMDEKDRSDFYFYIDEFQNFLTDSIESILSEARKYKLILNVAHQYIGQLTKGGDEAIKNAIFGNVGTKVCFRIGIDDSEVMEKEYEPVFSRNDLMNVEARNAYMKLMINQSVSRPFNMATYPPPQSDIELKKALKEISRLTYGRDREIIEREIRERNIE